MMDFFESFNFVWFCFGLIMFIANFGVLLIRNHLIKVNSVDKVQESGIYKIKLPAISMALLATVCICNIIDYLFDTNIFLIDVFLWFVGFVVYFFIHLFCKNPYILVFTWTIVFDLIWLAIFVVALVNTIVLKNYDEIAGSALIFMCLSTVALVFVQIILILYYRSLIKSIELNDENVIINTYHKKYILFGKYFTEVNENLDNKRTIIKYNDGHKKMSFIISMVRYSPFKIYQLNIDEMKKHMPNASFK